VSKAPNLADETQQQGITQDINDNDFTVYAIAFVIEIVAVILFVATLWLAIKP